MNKYLFIFIDSLPYERIAVAEFIAGLPVNIRLIPGLGYSVNLLPELFMGMSPDEVGFFGEWTYDPSYSPFKFRQVGRMLQYVAQSHYYVDRFLHKALGRLLQVHLAQIPFNMIPYFSHNELSVYHAPMANKTIFSSNNAAMKVIRSEKFPGELGRRDDAAIEAAYHLLDSNLFISLVDLDGFGHMYGVTSEEHDNYIRHIDREVARIWDLFQITNKGSDCFLVVLSDHGMSNVHEHTSLGQDMENIFGQPSPSRYIYFLDSTLLRVWILDSKLREDIASFLAERKEGKLLSSEERDIFGVTSPYTGDLLYVLHEGIVFIPSFHGLRIPNGMHGYHPDVPLQHAVLASSGLISNPDVLRSNEVFELLRDELGL